MSPAHVAVVVGGFAAVTALSVLAWLRFRSATTTRWRALDTEGAFFSGDVDPFALRRALTAARIALARHSVFSGPEVTHATSDLKILVQPELKWYRGGALIAGQCDVETGVVVVGRDLSALCHELGHLCRWRLHRATDDTHGPAWQAAGIERAVSAYLNTELPAVRG